MRTFKKVLTLTAMAAALQACGGGEVGESLVAPAPTGVSSKVIFDPTLGGDGLPFPTDLFYSGSADGSINIPGQPNSVPMGADPSAYNPAFIAMNTMDGFSTTAPMVVRFSGAIDDPSDPDDLKNGVKLYQAAFNPGASGGVTIERALIWGVDYVAGVSSGTSLLIQQLKPLSPSKTYIVAITNAVKTTRGNPVTADDKYALLNGSTAFALGAMLATPDYVTQGDGTTPCDFSNPPASLATCTTRNPAYALAPSPLAETLAALSLPELFALEPLRRITYSHLAALVGQGVIITDVKLSYSVSTQNIGGALTAAKAQVDGAGTAPSIEVLNPVSLWGASNPYPFPIEVVSPGDDGIPNAADDHSAHIYLGTLHDVVEFLDPTDQNGSTWRGAGDSNLGFANAFTPATALTNHSVPVLISAPRPEILAGSECTAYLGGPGMPVAIYQHGITTSRATLLAIADSLAKKCIVGVAIDMPKHGILPQNDPFGASQIAQLYQGLQQANMVSPSTLERLVQVASPMTECSAKIGTAIGNGDFYCPSGDNFINLANLANARDGLRQAVTDLSSLYRALVDNGATLSAATIGGPIDTANIHFVGVSLGAIVGAPFVSLNDGNLVSATLNVAGGGIAKILDGSPAFEPSITSGLYATGGIAKPSGSYEGFLIMAQTLVDNTDPINFAQALGEGSVPLLVQEVIGDPTKLSACIVSGTSCSDQVVPNNVFGTSFGPAWGVVSQSGQTSFLPGQNFITTPVALAGTDPMVQGTRFIAIAGAAAAGAPINPVALGPLGEDATFLPPLAVTFNGMALDSVGPCGAFNGGGPVSGVVRFSAGGHGSLLSPADSLAATAQMQTQMVGYIANQGAVIAPDAYGVVVNRPSDTQTTACVPGP